MNVTIENLNMESFTSQKHYIPKDKNYKGKNDANMDLYPYK